MTSGPMPSPGRMPIVWVKGILPNEKPPTEVDGPERTPAGGVRYVITMTTVCADIGDSGSQSERRRVKAGPLCRSASTPSDESRESRQTDSKFANRHECQKVVQ